MAHLEIGQLTKFLYFSKGDLNQQYMYSVQKIETCHPEILQKSDHFLRKCKKIAMFLGLKKFINVSGFRTDPAQKGRP